jgi:PKD repeat protein
MKKSNLSLFIVFFLYLMSFKCDAQKWQWGTKIGLYGGGNDYGLSMAKDGKGNILVTGRVKGPSTFGTGAGAVTPEGFGDRDIFIAKYDSLGNFIWARRYGGPTSDYGNGIATDANSNVYITGYFTDTAHFGSTIIVGNAGQNIFLAKVDEQGSLQWAKLVGGTTNGNGNSIAVDEVGNTFVTGVFFNSKAVFGKDTLLCAGGTDLFIAKFDSDGNSIWGRQAGNTSNDVGTSIAVSESGKNIYVCGIYLNKITFGTLNLPAYGNQDVFTVNYDTAGNCMWARRAGASGNEIPGALALDKTGDLYLTGTCDAQMSFESTGSPVILPASYGSVFLTKYGATAGNIISAKQVISGTKNIGSAVSTGITVNKFNNPVFCGYFTGTCMFDTLSKTVQGNSQDVFVSEYDMTSRLIWLKTYKGIAKGGINASGHSVLTDNTEHTYLTGGFLDTVYFDTIKLVAAGVSSDVFTGKLSPYVKAQFSASASAICKGQNISFSDLSRGWPTDWQWKFPGSTTLTQTSRNPVVTYNVPGNYDVELIIFNGIEKDTFLIPHYITVNECTVGINTLNPDLALEASFSPNPFSQSTELVVTGVSTNFVSVKILNVIGECVIKADLNGENRLHIERGNLTPGIYIYALYDKSTLLKTGKIIID